MKYCVYLYEGNLKEAGLREQLTRAAVEAYCLHLGIPCGDMRIERTEKGKPYVRGIGETVELSVTHTGDLWMALVGPETCGIDLQRIVPCRWQEISRRKFEEAEADFVERAGEPGFYQLWTRREAYGKMIGEGFWGPRPSLVDESGRLLDEVKSGVHSAACFRELEMGPDLVCTICTEHPYYKLEWCRWDES